MKLRMGIGLAVVLLGAVCLPQVGRAAGSTSIAGAPQLVYGQLEAGGGTPDEFWRIAAYGGDQLTLRIDWGTDTLGEIEIFAPGVDDYTLGEAKPVGFWRSDGDEGGKRQYTFTIPFSGTGTLAICERNGGSCEDNPPGGVNFGDVSQPFSFTLTDAHATSLGLSAPTLAHRRSRVTVTGRVQSPAGVSQGSCLFPHQTVVALSTTGTCSARVRLGGGHHQSIRVEFVPADGWQASSTTRTIRLVR